MVRLSSDRLDNFIDRIKAIVDLQDEEIKNCALLALIEELEELRQSDKEQMSNVSDEEADELYERI